jgi:Na+/H+ antiporter NhaD/arsenite permease-like protein
MTSVDKIIIIIIILFIILYVKYFYKIINKHLEKGEFLDNHPTYGDPFYIHFSIVVISILLIITIINKFLR